MACCRFQRKTLDPRTLIRFALSGGGFPFLIWLAIDDGDGGDFLNLFLTYFQFIVPFSCVILCGGLIRNEVQEDTLSFFITRPVTRVKLMLGKYLAAILFLSLGLAIELGMILQVGKLKGIEFSSAILGTTLVAQTMGIFSWGALGALFGIFTTKPILWAFIYGFIVEFGIGRIPTNVNNLSIMNHLHALLAQNPVFAEFESQWVADGMTWHFLILLVAPIILIGLASIGFKIREFHPGLEGQK